MIEKQDQLNNMRNMAGNIAVYVKQLHDMAYAQYDMESEAGSRSQSRDRLLCEIGTYCINIEHNIKRITDNLDMLSEIPRDFKVADDFEVWLMR